MFVYVMQGFLNFFCLSDFFDIKNLIEVLRFKAINSVVQQQICVFLVLINGLIFYFSLFLFIYLNKNYVVIYLTNLVNI